MEGGIRAWEGLAAEGPPEAGMAYFDGSETPQELTGLAWLLENGSRRFYLGLYSRSHDEEAKKLFRNLSVAEEHHKTALENAYREITGSDTGENFPESVLSTLPPEEIMDGGVKVDKALEWAQRKNLNDILDYSISLETNSYDLYIKMERRMDRDEEKRIFRMLSEEEKGHLRRLATLLEKKM
jgi:rubrerythrin